MKTIETVMADLENLLQNFQGREYAGKITPETMFFSDLGFVSIDAVVLGETLQDLYGQAIPLNRFLADAAQRKVQDIQVGELAEFLVSNLA